MKNPGRARVFSSCAELWGVYSSGMSTLIVFEGIDGVGKATQVELLAQRLRADGTRVAVFTSPRYDLPTGAIIRDALHGTYGDFVGLSPYLSAQPYLLDFAAWKDQIDAALGEGMVICDRYVSSTVAYHSAKLTGDHAQQFVELIEDIAYERLKLPRPDMTVYLQLPVELARRRMSAKKRDQFERDAGYQGRVAAAYGELAKRTDWRTVECVKEGSMRSVEDIQEEVRQLMRLVM